MARELKFVLVSASSSCETSEFSSLMAGLAYISTGSPDATVFTLTIPARTCSLSLDRDDLVKFKSAGLLYLNLCFLFESYPLFF